VKQVSGQKAAKTIPKRGDVIHSGRPATSVEIAGRYVHCQEMCLQINDVAVLICWILWLATHLATQGVGARQ
jgi:hypothetical protein